MRVAWGLLACLLLTLVPGSAAQDPAGIPLLDDRGADGAFVVAETPVSTNGRWAALDLVALTGTESRDDITFTLEVGDLAANPEAPFLENVAYRIMFRVGATEYWVHIFRYLEGTAPGYFSLLEEYDPDADETTPLSVLDLEVDGGAGLLTVAVPRDLLLDENGAPPYPGTALTDFHVLAHSPGVADGTLVSGPAGDVQFPSLRAEDRMPDEGNGTVGLAITLGVAQTGHARLSSDAPVRASNGEATTFVFKVTARNAGLDDDHFTLSASGHPSNWHVNLPVALVEIPAGQSIDLPVLVTTPFFHEHGSFKDFRVELQSLSDAGSTGRVQLGVRYNAIPQPAGHHDTVYLHSRTLSDQEADIAFSTLFGFPLQQATMNALPNDEADEDVDVPARGPWTDVGTGGPTMTYRWTVPLSPGLAMGLDFDLGRTGTVKVPVRTLLPMTQATLEGTLYHEVAEPDGVFGEPGERQRTPIARLEPTPPADVAAQGEVLYETAVTPLPAADFIPFNPDGALTLQLNLTFVRVDPFAGPRQAPVLEPGGEMRLPLFEYRDPVDEVFQSLAAVALEADGAQEALVNAGETTVFRLRLLNHGDDAAFHLNLTGPHAEWARVLGSPHVEVAAGGVREVAVAVAVPAGAGDGEVADLIVQAAHAHDPKVRTLARLVATVDADADHPDMASEADELDGRLTERDAPAAHSGLIAVALAALVAAVRRRN